MPPILTKADVARFRHLWIETNIAMPVIAAQLGLEPTDAIILWLLRSARRRFGARDEGQVATQGDGDACAELPASMCPMHGVSVPPLVDELDDERPVARGVRRRCQVERCGAMFRPARISDVACPACSGAGMKAPSPPARSDCGNSLGNAAS